MTMEAVIFQSVAEYADYASKMTIKWKGRETQIEIWSSDGKTDIKTTKYWTAARAYRAYELAIGRAVLGGWKVMNMHPKKVTWKKDGQG